MTVALDDTLLRRSCQKHNFDVNVHDPKFPQRATRLRMQFNAKPGTAPKATLDVSYYYGM